MNILFAASEAYPFCKTGGLADVMGSLPVALAENGDNVSVILPLYQQVVEHWQDKLQFRCHIYVDLAWRHQYCGLFSLRQQGVTWYFVDNEYYFLRDTLYGHYDDGERFAFFSRAVVDLLPMLDEKPDVVHCNDWQTALVSVYLKEAAAHKTDLQGTHTVFTIHNIAYQGRFGQPFLHDVLGLPDGWWTDGTLRMDDDINLVKAAIMVSDKTTTVSPTYARELLDPTYAHHLESIVALVSEKGRFAGILNGIDTVSFDPRTDPALVAAYSPKDQSGKQLCKAALQKELGLAEEQGTPVLSVISRLVGHKGMSLLCREFDNIMALGVQLVILGMGESAYEDFFRGKADQYPGQVAACITYDDALSRRIYAGSDLLLMPSRSEPCGLSQMIAMRYGTVPVVRRTGGLYDSVVPYHPGQSDGSGFAFVPYETAALLSAVQKAVSVYRDDPITFKALQQNGMTADFSWDHSARQYRKLYSE